MKLMIEIRYDRAVLLPLEAASLLGTGIVILEKDGWAWKPCEEEMEMKVVPDSFSGKEHQEKSYKEDAE